MKVLLLLSAVVCGVRADAVFWPGAIPLSDSNVKTVLTNQEKGFLYSSRQYINAIPPYTVGYQPQISYQVPQIGVYPPYAGIPSYQPALAPAYYPGAGFVYPVPEVSPVFPPLNTPIAPPAQQPIQSTPVEQPSGDDDTTVVDSAEFSSGQPSQSYDTKNMPEIPQVPSVPQMPSIPNIPAIPSIPSSGINFSQFSQFTQPPQQQQFENNQFETQNSGFASSSQPSNQNLNDEDTVSVESA